MIWDTERLSLMTFAMGFDIFAGRITIEDSLRIAKECGVPAVDVMNVSEKQAVQYVRAMQNTGTEVYCYIAMIPFFRAESKVVCAIEKELRIAQQLHAKLLMIVPGGAPEIKWARRRPREEIVSRIAWGYIDTGVIPKFAGCVNGVQWFKDRGQWADNSIEPTPGMIIFFDWDSPNGSSGPQDGQSDHVGIVEKCENGIVYTIEGNSGDSCRQRQYSVGYYEILGYGIPAY